MPLGFSHLSVTESINNLTYPVLWPEEAATRAKLKTLIELTKLRTNYTFQSRHFKTQTSLSPKSHLYNLHKNTAFTSLNKTLQLGKHHLHKLLLHHTLSHTALHSHVTPVPELQPQRAELVNVSHTGMFLKFLKIFKNQVPQNMCQKKERRV